MRPYLDLLRHVHDHGVRKGDRTGTGTLSVFGHQMRFDLSEGFPLVTTKKMFVKGLAVEMLWFLRGDTNIRYLVERGVSIWTDWPLKHYLEAQGRAVPPSDTPAWKTLRTEFEQRICEDDAFAAAWGDLGPVYGKQWRAWTGPDGEAIDQLGRVVEALRANPDSRRHLVNAWNVADLPRMALPPCHLMYQFYVAPPAEGATRGRLSCQLYVRSNDLFLGAPFNIAQYALLTHLVAQQTDLDVGDFVYTIGDAHIYLNHVDQVREQLTRTPYDRPRLVLHRRAPSLFDYDYADLEVVGYQHHPAIKAPVAV